ncbi:IS21 family transposase [Bifidobacterium eulemuris]|uniref:IS21 family transposase n=2 Tax=Bifidobacterium eulemuris TaxID=1765219 RepID=A0A7L9SQP9_9BIFI|nr:IS21 family transposase [Bifidobacterium eulemuris]QOL32661.1 IS21 family transposase [Bifidobacterium eulemuris]
MVRKIKAKTILRLSERGLSGRAIARSQGVARRSVAETLDAATSAGVGWADVAGKTDDEVYALLFPGRGDRESVYERPDWARVHRELARVGVTLRILHGEYMDGCRQAGKPYMGYDRFCKLYAAYVAGLGAASRVEHKAGRTIEVDWAGKTMRIVDPVTGDSSRVYLFVAVLPFSRYAFVEPALDMGQNSWLRCHVAMFEWFGGSTPRLVCDNLKTGVVKHPREGEVVLNDAYRGLAEHYSAAVLPGRVRRPKDKPSVENTVWHATMALAGAMRDREFGSLDELRAAIRAWLMEYNSRPFQKRDGSRLSVFESEEGPLLIALPPLPYEVADWVYGRRVQANGHVAWARNWYSVPHAYVGSAVDLRIGASTLEVWRKNTRLCTHRLLPATVANRYSTNEADLPDKATWKPWDRKRCEQWARRIGPGCAAVIGRLFAAERLDEQGVDPALAVLRLSKRYSAQRLENACALALRSAASPRYSHIRPILESWQDRTDEIPDDDGGGIGDGPGAGGWVRGGYYASMGR